MKDALHALLGDVAEETAALDDLLVTLSTQEWSLPTPSPGWSIRDQVSHLAWLDEAALMAATDPQRFRDEAAAALTVGPEFTNQMALRYRSLELDELHAWFLEARREMSAALEAMDGTARVPWYGPDMSVMSLATARLMETWAHGQDVYDAVGVERVATNRLQHVAHLGFRTMAFSFAVHGLPAPEAPVRVVLRSPTGDEWSWGPDAALDEVTGSALGFCLIVTKRRHVEDTDIVTKGPIATEWMSIAQAFAGPPGQGRQPQGQGVGQL